MGLFYYEDDAIMDELIFDFDLQLFAEDSPTGQKTEEASPFRREEARKKGQTAKSMDLNGAVVMLVGFVTLYATAEYTMGNIMEYTRRLFSQIYNPPLDIGRVEIVAIDFLYYWFLIIFPVVSATAVAALLVNVAQVGVIFTFEPMKFNPGKLNPINGFKKMFGLNAVNELGKSLLKVVATIYIPYRFFVLNFREFLKFIDYPIMISLGKLSYMTYRLCLEIIMVLLILSVLDWVYQKYEFEKSIKMSKYDVKQEYKQHEGDPHIKAALRRKMMQLSRQSMASEVPKADVIVTNPTHYAIALRYNQEAGDVAPVCLAKGTGAIALRIIDLGKENNVYIYQDPPLARSLFKDVDAGGEIPEQLFVAVAQILSVVYKNTGRSL